MRCLLLGPLVVTGGAGDPLTPAGRRLRVLLAALLLHSNVPVPAGELAEMVWDGSPSPEAVETLRSYIRRLRRALGPDAARVVASGAGYLIHAGQQELDVLEFETLCRGTRAALRAGQWQDASAAAARALRLWRAAPLLDVPAEALRGKFVPPLERLRLQVLEDMFDAGFRLGQHQDLIPRLVDATAEYPLQERFHAQLMLALARAGRRAQALHAYQEARGVLVGELGIEPGPELRGIHRQVLAGEVPGDDEPARDTPPGSAQPAGLREHRQLTLAAGPAAAAAPGNGARELALPGPAPPRPAPAGSVPDAQAAAALAVPRQLPGVAAHFTGRAAELAALDRVLDNASGQGPGTVVVSAIGGTAGVGKTALAVRWAHQAASRFPGGQLYVNLRGFGPSANPAAPAEAIRGFLDALGVPAERIPPGLAAQAALYRSLLADRKILVVLDNAHDEEQVRPLLPPGPCCLAIVTSRNQLTGLAAAEGARLLTLDVLTPAEARQMLSARLGGHYTGGDPEAVAEIAQLCEYLPLALAIAAARAAARPPLSLPALAAELRASQGPLDALDTGDPAASVRTVFSWSCQGLSELARRMFGLLGLHPGPDISVPAAASLAGAGQARTSASLAELARAHLIVEHAAGRYAMHDLLRAYAAEHAQTSQDDQARQAAVGRILDHYLHTAHQAAVLLNVSREPFSLAPALPGVIPEPLAGQQQALAWFDAECRVLVAAVALAAGSGLQSHAWQLPWTMADFLDRRGRWQDWSAVLRTALDAATGLGDTTGQAATRRLLAHACARLADYDQAHVHLTECLRLYRQIGDHAGSARAHLSLCWLIGHQARVADALGHAQEALTLFRAIPDPAGCAVALNNIGGCHLLLGDREGARAFCRQALALHRELGNRHGEATTWDSLGDVEHHLGNLAAAAACYQRALSLFRESGDRYEQAQVLTHLGDTYHAATNPPQARDAWQQALDILHQLHHPDAGEVRRKLVTLPGFTPAPAEGRLRQELA